MHPRPILLASRQPLVPVVFPLSHRMHLWAALLAGRPRLCLPSLLPGGRLCCRSSVASHASLASPLGQWAPLVPTTVGAAPHSRDLCPAAAVVIQLLHTNAAPPAKLVVAPLSHRMHLRPILPASRHRLCLPSFLLAGRPCSHTLMPLPTLGGCTQPQLWSLSVRLAVLDQ